MTKSYTQYDASQYKDEIRYFLEDFDVKMSDKNRIYDCKNFEAKLIG